MEWLTNLLQTPFMEGVTHAGSTIGEFISALAPMFPSIVIGVFLLNTIGFLVVVAIYRTVAP